MGSLSWLCCPRGVGATKCLRALNALEGSPPFSSCRAIYSFAIRLRSARNSGSCHFSRELAKERKADSESFPWRSSTISSARSAGSALELGAAWLSTAKGEAALSVLGTASDPFPALGCLLVVACGVVLLPSGFSSLALCNLHRRTPSFLLVAELRQPCTAHALLTNEPWYIER